MAAAAQPQRSASERAFWRRVSRSSGFANRYEDRVDVVRDQLNARLVSRGHSLSQLSNSTLRADIDRKIVDAVERLKPNRVSPDRIRLRTIIDEELNKILTSPIYISRFAGLDAYSLAGELGKLLMQALVDLKDPLIDRNMVYVQAYAGVRIFETAFSRDPNFPPQEANDILLRAKFELDKL